MEEVEMNKFKTICNKCNNDNVRLIMVEDYGMDDYKIPNGETKYICLTCGEEEISRPDYVCL